MFFIPRNERLLTKNQHDLKELFCRRNEISLAKADKKSFYQANAKFFYVEKSEKGQNVASKTQWSPLRPPDSVRNIQQRLFENRQKSA